MEIKDGDLVIQYENGGVLPIKPRVSVFLLNKYGSIISRFDDSWLVKAILPGGKDKSEAFKLPPVEGVRYIDVEADLSL